MDYTDTPPEVKGMVFILNNLGYSYREIADKLSSLGFKISKTNANKIID